MTEDLTKFEARSPGVPAVQPRADIVAMAIQNKLDPALIEKMMDLSERNEANEARRAYNEAMANFKFNPPDIAKDKTVSFGQGKTSYAHASLANVTEKINKALSAHGLSAGWKTAQDDKSITVTCTICHRQGHCESTSLIAAPDTSGSKNSIQAIGSTISYLQRYTLLAITGLATHDMMDDDGISAEPPKKITQDQCTEIDDLLKETSSNLKIFLKVAGAESVEAITADKYPLLINQLKTKQRQMRKPGDE